MGFFLLLYYLIFVIVLTKCLHTCDRVKHFIGYPLCSRPRAKCCVHRHTPRLKHLGVEAQMHNDLKTHGYKQAHTLSGPTADPRSSLCPAPLRAPSLHRGRSSGAAATLRSDSSSGNDTSASWKPSHFLSLPSPSPLHATLLLNYVPIIHEKRVCVCVLIHFKINT